MPCIFFYKSCVTYRQTNKSLKTIKTKTKCKLSYKIKEHYIYKFDWDGGMTSISNCIKDKPDRTPN